MLYKPPEQKHDVLKGQLRKLDMMTKQKNQLGVIAQLVLCLDRSILVLKIHCLRLLQE